MFQVSYFPPHGVTVVHPPEAAITPDSLFESDLVFVWGDLSDPHQVRERLGRHVPFAPATVSGYELRIGPNNGGWTSEVVPDEEKSVQGVVLVGLTEQEIEILDRQMQVPIRMLKHKIMCKIGNLERIVHIHLHQGALLER
jgi:Gamma-glutamyl cyclotransferase, AIG2-like